ncbi:MAG: 1-deoxy-D-xylulose-5-phosphate reductoisomerase [Verrucomicrobia bacterium]|nr:MAG: 1-deoxy-D-xylulose-5-phosphate reductoisomerase [Verrucomicrobiota bacterium]
MDSRRKIILIGATGSIGANALRVIEKHADRLELVGIAAHRRFEPLAEIARRFSVPHVGLFDADCTPDMGQLPSGCRFHAGLDGITEMAAGVEADIVLVASVGTASLRPTLAAIEAGRSIALATKEILVMAGAFVMEAARRHGVSIIPVDSEHNAIYQCLAGAPGRHLRRIVLTASGGAFLDTPLAALADVTPEQALAHPNWSMGPKITIDSATMANKGLEVIEARWLFDLEPAQIDVVIHRQSIVHSMVEFVDGSFLAQLSPPSMTFAIQHALLFPERAPGVDRSLDFTTAFSLDFAPLEPGRFRCLDLACAALRAGGVAPAVFNAANEVAVDAFVRRAIGFLEIPEVIERTMDAIGHPAAATLDDVLAAEVESRAVARRFC